jgi:DNA-binding transcriptional LysR family regulator
MPNLRRKLPSANALFVFEAAARCGNFTRAAQELYVSQPAVSRMLARMEEYLGVQLFERVRGGLELTENGRILYDQVSAGFERIEAAVREIEARSTGVETVVLSVSTAFTTHWLMPRMTRLNEAFPNLDLRFHLDAGKLTSALVDVDLGMRIRTPDEVGENSRLIMAETILPVCSSTYKSAASGDTVIVMDDTERSLYERFNAFCQQRRHVGGVLRFNDYAIVLQAALLGQGIAIGWLNVVTHWLNEGTLIPAELELVQTGRHLYLQWPENRPNRPIVVALRDWIIEEIWADLARADKAYPELGIADTLAHPRLAATMQQ